MGSGKIWAGSKSGKIDSEFLMEVEVEATSLTEFAQQNHSCNPATRPKQGERRHVSYPFFHPQCLAQCLTQRRHPTGAELSADALEQVPAEAGATPFKEQ